MVQLSPSPNVIVVAVAHTPVQRPSTYSVAGSLELDLSDAISLCVTLLNGHTCQ